MLSISKPYLVPIVVVCWVVGLHVGHHVSRAWIVIYTLSLRVRLLGAVAGDTRESSCQSKGDKECVYMHIHISILFKILEYSVFELALSQALSHLHRQRKAPISTMRNPDDSQDMPILARIQRHVNTLSHLTLGFVVCKSSTSMLIFRVFHLPMYVGILVIEIWGRI